MRKFEMRYSAKWQDGDVALHLSLCRNTKPVFGGRSIGVISLSWNNEILAVAPYMPELIEKEK